MKTEHIIYLLLASVLLSVSVGLYNNFPVTYPDSAAYLYSGIENILPLDRPIFYGWFLRYTHFNDNLFFSIIVQGLISTYVIYLFFIYFSRAQNKYIHFILALLFLCCFTGYSFYVSFLMPDIFTFVFLLCISLLFFANLSWFHFWIITFLCFFSTIVHNSHFPIFILCLVVLGYLHVIRKKGADKNIYSKKWLTVFCVFSISIILSLLVNFSFTNKLFLSRNGHVFLTSRLHELNILESFLAEKCPHTQYVLCPYKDSIPPDFIWDMASPLHKTGGFENSGPEYTKMIMAIFTDVKYLKKFVVASLVSTVQQLGSFEIEPQQPNILQYIKEKFSVHKLTQNISFQNRGGTIRRFNFEKLNFIQNIIILTSFSFLCLLLLIYKNISKVHRGLIVFIFWSLFINAFVCSTFSTLLARYQGRLVFILPLLLILVIPGIDWGVIKKYFEPEEKVL